MVTLSKEMQILLSFDISIGLIPEPLWIPNPKDALVPYVKWPSTSSPHPIQGLCIHGYRGWTVLSVGNTEKV